MKEIKLTKLTLHKFQALEDVVIEANGKNINLYGDNGSGKTTIGNALSWLLFDKSLENAKDFGVKNHNLKTHQGVVYSVECEFTVNGNKLSFKRDFFEKWVKDRKTTQMVMRGHENEYFVNGVPRDRTHYNNEISNLIDERTFRIISQPQFFSTQLPWKEQRKIVLDVCGDIADDVVFKSNEELVELKKKMGTLSIEDYKITIEHKHKKISDEITNLPGAIGEATYNLDVCGYDKTMNLDDYETARKNAEIIIGAEENKREQLGSRYDLYTEYQSSLSNTQNLINNRKLVLENELDGKLRESEFGISNKNRDIQSQQYEIDVAKKILQDEEETKARLTQKRSLLLTEYHAENKKELTETTVSTSCYACGSDLSADKVEENKQKKIDEFNTAKETKVAEITSQGTETKTNLNACLVRIKDQETSVSTLEKGLETLKSEKNTLEIELQSMKNTKIVVEDDAIYKGYLETLKDLQQNAVIQPSFDSKKLEDTKLQLDGINQVLSDKDEFDRYTLRLGELMTQEKTKQRELLNINMDIESTKLFYKTKVGFIEKVIAKKFKKARFKMFNTLVNGGLEETCEVMYEGVPYTKGLNNGSKINVGLDIINTLFDYYGVKVPIIIDNAESVTDIYPIDTQLVTLSVSKEDKTIRIEEGH